MRRNSSAVFLLTLGAFATATLGGCARKEAPAASAAVAPSPAPSPAGDGKIPVTTSSPEAKTEFLKGRELAEKLQVTDSIQHFQKAASLDPDFASAELSLSTTAPTGKEAFEHLNRAVSLADKVSNGEKLLILATQDGTNNDALKQKEHLEALVAAYPNDERAHFNLGGFYFGQQEYAKAIEQYKKATEIAPGYSAAYNILGYSYRQTESFADAEKAFQKYVELIPKDPNPYDSYAELLLKMGRFDESIAQYRKALAIEPNFVNAHQGIAMDLLYSGKPDQAAAELAVMEKKARNDGEKRTALFARTIVHIDRGQMARALSDVDEQYALGEKTNDVPAMVFDRGLRGNILLEMGKADQARTEFDAGAKLVEASTLSQEIKDNTKLFHHYNLARVALARKDFATAKSEADEFRKGSATSKNPFRVRLVHELDGTVALAEKDFEKASAELQQSNLQNPQDLYRLCQALGARGDTAKAAEFCKKAAEFNALPTLQYAFVRTKARAGAPKRGK